MPHYRVTVFTKVQRTPFTHRINHQPKLTFTCRAHFPRVSAVPMNKTCQERRIDPFREPTKKGNPDQSTRNSNSAERVSNMTAQPKSINLKPGARILTPPIPGGQPVVAYQNDVVTNGTSGWHVVISAKPIQIPVGGYPVGYSDDSVHWSRGPSFSGQDIPGSMSASSSFDATQSGYGSDGRASLDGATIGGACGAAAGGVSGQSTTGAGNVGGGSGSAARGF